MIDQRRKERMRGSISLFLALILTCFLVLICTLLESARVSALRGLIRQAGDTSVDSLFAGFDKSLFDQYGLLFLYGGGNGGLIEFETLEDRFRTYFNANSGHGILSSGMPLYPMTLEDASVSEVMTATDYSGEIFIRSVLDFYKFDAVDSVFDEIQENLNIINTIDLSGTATGRTNGNHAFGKAGFLSGDKRFISVKTSADMLFSGELPEPGGDGASETGSDEMSETEPDENPEMGADEMAESGAGEIQQPGQDTQGAETDMNPETGTEAGEAAEDEPEPFDQERYDEAIGGSVIGQAENLKKGGWLSIVIPPERAISNYTFITEEFPSVVNRDDRKLPGDDAFWENTAAKVILGEYVLDYFPNFMSGSAETVSVSSEMPSETADISPGGRTEAAPDLSQYEAEYILFGKGSDAENLKTTLNRIMWIREALNLANIMASEKKSEAEAAAALLVGWTGIEALIYVAAGAIEAAWAYAESLCDVKILLSGGKVPLYKEPWDWNLNLSNVADFFRGVFDTSGSHDRGLSYESHLRFLLFMTDTEDVAYRAMDMIQMHRRKADASYLFSSEIYAMEIEADISAPQVFTMMPFVRKTLFTGWSDYRAEDHFSRSY